MRTVKFWLAPVVAWALLGVASVSLADSDSKQPTSSTGFRFQEDTFAFRNETYFAYDEGQHPQARAENDPARRAYSRRCFVMARSVMQFFQFARFEPDAPKLNDAEYRRHVRAICRIPLWHGNYPPEKRIVIPGYANLREFSAAKPRLLQEEIGTWWAGYFRFGNYRLPLPFPRCLQAEAARKLRERLQRGDLQAVYMMRIPWLNHNIVLFDARELPNGDVVFLTYDCNLNDAPRELRFNAKTQTFEYPKTFYFRGGAVNVFRTYISPVH